MGRLISAALLVISGGGASIFAGQPIWIGIAAAGVIAVAIWQFTVCRHPRPLALLPPVHDGSADNGAHWFCAACGARWPAAFEHSSRPTQKFFGYDESKAKDSARRADMLELRSRELAVQRAGMDRSAGKLRRRSEPVPIQSGRMVG